MGSTILRLAAADPRFQVVGALEAGGHPALEKPLAGLFPDVKFSPSAVLRASLDGFSSVPQVFLDFSSPEATARYAHQAAAAGKIGLVIGTTGLSDSDRRHIQAVSTKVPVVLSSNMSVGMNLLFDLVERAARVLGPGFDGEIVEVHHNRKKDAPSGSALALGEALARGKGLSLAKAARHGRAGTPGPRKPGEIGFHAVRAGDVVGDHTVLLAGPSERLEFVHRAHGREAFARGALEAALFAARKKRGLYDMRDVLGLRGR